MPKHAAETTEDDRDNSRSKDRHASGFMIRLPMAHRKALEQLQAKHRRPLTTEVQIALEKHYRDEGVELKPESEVAGKVGRQQGGKSR